MDRSARARSRLTTSHAIPLPFPPVYSSLHAVVFPNNGSKTPLFDPCFEQVDTYCASDMAEALSFCAAIQASPTEDGKHGMQHVIEVRATTALARR